MKCIKSWVHSVDTWHIDTEGENAVCISCGCGNPNDDHGDPRNITMDDLNQAAQAAGTTRDRVLQNIMSGSQGGSASGWQGRQQSGYDQPQNQRSSSNQSQSQQNNYGQTHDQPDTAVPTPGQEGGTAWRQDLEDVNYQPPAGQSTS
jgi:hypothetical protein